MSVGIRMTTPNNNGAERPSEAVPVHRSVLLATDGSPTAFAATRFVSQLATRWSTRPNVCTVVPPPPMAFDPAVVGVVYTPAIEQELRDQVTRQLEAAGANASDWPRDTTVGDPAGEIVRLASLQDSDLIVLGLRPHVLLDRMFRDETALSVMRHASVPVLAVTPALTQLPKRVAVAIDFSRASIAAARAALTVLDDDGILVLVYVEPPPEPRTQDREGYATIFAQGVAAAFSRLRCELTSRTKSQVETVVLQGSVAPELLSFANRAQMDLIAVGSQRHTIARRAVVGSVTTALARAATCSLLVIPPGRLA